MVCFSLALGKISHGLSGIFFVCRRTIISLFFVVVFIEELLVCQFFIFESKEVYVCISRFHISHLKGIHSRSTVLQRKYNEAVFVSVGLRMLFFSIRVHELCKVVLQVLQLQFVIRQYDRKTLFSLCLKNLKNVFSGFEQCAVIRCFGVESPVE